MRLHFKKDTGDITGAVTKLSLSNGKEGTDPAEKEQNEEEAAEQELQEEERK